MFLFWTVPLEINNSTCTFAYFDIHITMFDLSSDVAAVQQQEDGNQTYTLQSICHVRVVRSLLTHWVKMLTHLTPKDMPTY